MKLRTLTAILVFCFCSIASGWPIQTTTTPVTKQEILSRLKETEAHHLSQADIVAEINQRGIDFFADAKFLNELRQLGARSFLLNALERSSKDSGKPQIGDPKPQKQETPIQDVETPAESRDAMIAKLPFLEQARIYALDFSEELPNFIVNQDVTRYIQQPGEKDWHQSDRLEIELTYHIGKGEDFNLLRVDGKPTTQTYQQIGGSTSTGEFGSAMAAVFAPQSKAEFKEVKRETFRGHQTIVYDFKIKRANSLSTLTESNLGRKVVAGYSGTMWIDTETKRVLRIETANDDIPAGFPITLAENAVEYDWVKIGDQRFMLPVHAELLLGIEAKKYYTKNVIEFRNYRRFEAKIKMDPNN